jgi:HK97 family phage portal protein
MKLFGFEISRQEKTLSAPANTRGGWIGLIREPFSGAWQKNLEELSPDTCLAFHAVFACHTLICSDVAKLRVKLVAQKGDVWQETTSPAFSPVLRKPNNFQNRIQFFESWVNSKLARGNAYILKARDGRGVVTGLYVLNPDRVTPLVSDDGQVFYQLAKDNLSGLEEVQAIVPARGIIHDRFNCLFHPLVGISPLYASALAATQGTNIQRSSARLAANGVRPGGLLTFPGKIPADDAKRLKEDWQEKYSGPSGAAKIAILGEGAKFESLTMTSDEAQLIEQLKYTAEVICSTYHVPPYKIGGTLPTYANIQSLNVEYYSQCLQALIESIELCLDEGLGIGEGTVTNGVTYGTEFDVDNLLRMDSVTQMEMLDKAQGKLEVDEIRQKLGYAPTKGGNAVYLQQQNYSLEALAKRDAKDDPFGTAKPAPDPAANDNAAAQEAMKLLATVTKGFADV